MFEEGDDEEDTVPEHMTLPPNTRSVRGFSCLKICKHITELGDSEEERWVAVKFSRCFDLFQAIHKPRDALMCRANSLKKAVRQIIEHTERGKGLAILRSKS